MESTHSTHRTPWLTSILLTFLVATLFGCAPSSPIRIEASRVKGYHTVSALVADADAIVIAQATTDHRIERIASVPFTVVVMEVLDVLKGSVEKGARINLRQTGDGKVTVEDAPAVSPGTTYLLFLNRFTFGPGRETDQFVIVGVAAGMYEVHALEASRLDTLSPDLPTTISLDMLRNQLR